TQQMPVAPTYQPPAYEQPAYEQPAYEPPAYQAPSYGPPPASMPPTAPPPAATPAAKRPWGMIAGVAAVAGLAIGGTYLVTKSDSKGTGSPAVAVTSTLPGTVAPTVAPPPSSTLPTSVAPEPTAAPAPTGDLLDLGLGVAVPVAAGFEQVESGTSVTRMSSGSVTLEVQVLQREPGEDASVLAQEYANTFDGDFSAVSYSNVTSVVAGQGALRATSFDYATLNADTGETLYGTVELLVRPDGLSAIIDQYAEASTEQTSPEAWLGELATATLAAPSLGDSVPLADVQPFILDSVHESVYLSDQVRFVIAPGFTLAQQEGAVATLNNGTYVFEAELVTGVATLDDLVDYGKSVMAELVPGASVDSTDDVTIGGLTRRSLRIEGASVAGQQIAGYADFYFDAATGNGVWTWNVWDTATSATDPYETDVIFMLHSLTIKDGIS
ncbi:MAG: hypothetical protein ABMA25_22240, partial [Ilumatobacteraceae bacterium]